MRGWDYQAGGLAVGARDHRATVGGPERAAAHLRGESLLAAAWHGADAPGWRRPSDAGAVRAAPSDQRPLAELLDDLSRRLAMADPAVREEVTRLVLRYLENPPAGARIAKAIELLLGQDEVPRDA